MLARSYTTLTSLFEVSSNNSFTFSIRIICSSLALLSYFCSYLDSSFSTSFLGLRKSEADVRGL